MKLLKRMTPVFIMFVLGLLFVASDSFAAEDWSGATSVNVNEEFTGNVNKGSRDEKDIYSFSLSESGAVQIHFKNPLQGTTDSYWSVEVVDGSYKSILEYEVKGNKEQTDSVKLGLSSGMYYFSVASADYYQAKSTDTYTIEVGFEATNSWEEEFNESFSTANTITVNEEKKGTTRYGNGKEKDYYKFTLDQPGYIYLKIQTVLQTNKNNYWRVHLYTGDYTELMEWNVNGAFTLHTYPKVGFGSGDYYVSIESSDYYTALSIDVYNLTVVYEKSEYWEREINDDFRSANTIQINTVYNGSVYDGNGNEKDYYVFDIQNKDEYKIVMNTLKQDDTSNYWKMCLYDSKYDEVTNITVKGNETTKYINKVLDVGKYYVLIESSDYYNAISTDLYSIKVESKTTSTPVVTTPPEDTGVETQISIPSASINKVKRLKKGFKVTWDVNGEVDGFEIDYSLSKYLFNKKSRRVTNPSQRSLTIKKLKRKKYYYVIIRAYKYIDGIPYYSHWSITKRVRTK